MRLDADGIRHRFKSWVGGQGITEDVVWKNIRLYNVTYPALITQVSLSISRDRGTHD